MEVQDFVVDVIDDDEVMHEDARIQKRYIRDGLNPVEQYNDQEFRRRFRFTKDAVLHFIMPKIAPGLQRSNNRGLPIVPLMQLLITLRFYATASFQMTLADVSSVSQPTVSRILRRVTHLLAIQMRDFIKMPATAEAIETNRLDFADLMRRRNYPDDPVIPNVDGAIDCTHVRLVSTKLQQIAEVFRNRKSYFSLNVQAVVGARMQFLDIVPNWPGSSHDSRIFQNCRLNYKYSSGQINGVLLGDSGYRSMAYLLTPFLNPQTRGEERYNSAQKRGRNVVERTFGVLKRRFPCLSRGLSNELGTSTTIIVACAVLHNMALVMNDRWEEEDIDEVNDVVPVADADDNMPDGLAARREIVRLYFQ